jgi:hypothetical protein
MKYIFDVRCVTFAVCGISKGRSFRCCQAKVWQHRRSACELEVLECPGHVWIKRGRPGSRTLSSSPLLLHRRLWIAAQGTARCTNGQYQERRIEHNQRLTGAKHKRRIGVMQFMQSCDVLDEDPLEILREVSGR